MPRLWTLTLVAALGCTRSNPGFTGGDLSGADLNADQSVPMDLAAQAQDRPMVIDLPATIDLPAATDFSTATDLAKPDAAKPVDLGRSDLTSCGAAAQPCCTGSVCAPGFACDVANQCVPCGGPGQACCGTSCDAGGCCVSNVCVPSGHNCSNANEVCAGGSCTACGGPTLPCCENNSCTGGCCDPLKGCITTGATCSGGGAGTCMTSGACTTCGGTSQRCCPGGPSLPNSCSAGGTVCAPAGPLGGGVCETCGGDGEPCCRDNSCSAGGCCVGGTCRGDGTSCGGGMTCMTGACANGGVLCGGLGDGCCPATNSYCTAPSTRCVGTSCVACGGKNQRCCWDYQSNQALGCGAPYRPTFAGTNCTCL